MHEFVTERVHRYYWDNGFNCASTTLKVMADYFDISIHRQVIDAAVGMHGAGGYRAQCGIVEGTLMFAGVIGRAKGFSEDEIISFCHDFARNFETVFGSLSCRVLRPQGFSDDDPLHQCEELTVNGVAHNLGLVSDWLLKGPKHKQDLYGETAQ